MKSLEEALVGHAFGALVDAVKVVALFLTALIGFRMTERRTLAEFAPFDWIAAVAVGAIVGRTATASDSSWLDGAGALIALLVAHSVIARLRFVPGVRRLTDPPLRVLVRDGRVENGNLRRCGITHADLDTILRQHGHMRVEDVHLAIFEAKGAVTVVPMRDAPVVPGR